MIPDTESLSYELQGYANQANDGGLAVVWEAWEDLADVVEMIENGGQPEAAKVRDMLAVALRDMVEIDDLSMLSQVGHVLAEHYADIHGPYAFAMAAIGIMAGRKAREIGWETE